MSDQQNLPATAEQTAARQSEARHNDNGLPPVEIMQRMLDLQEKRLALDSRQMDINERELDNNKSLGLKSMELNSKANTEQTSAMVRVMGWRYIFWGVVGLLAVAATITALVLGKEAFALEALKYLAIFLGGYGTRAVTSSRKSMPAPEVDD